MCLGGYLWCCNANNKAIPLTGVVVRAKIVDFCAEVTLEQRYENVEDFPIEALCPHHITSHHTTHHTPHTTQHTTLPNSPPFLDLPRYVFPLEEKASVSNFYATVDGNKVNGVLKEKEQARDVYDGAIASGKSAYLLEEGKESRQREKTKEKRKEKGKEKR
jgi:Vault protein inter-alpha-trypsin domain